MYAIDGGGIFEYKIALIYSHFCSERGVHLSVNPVSGGGM